MSTSAEKLAGLIESRFGARVSACAARLGEVTVEVPPENLLAVCRELRDGEGLEFDQLLDACGVDYLDYGRGDWETSESASAGGFSRGVAPSTRAATAPAGGRFAAVYHLLSHSTNRRLRVRCFAAGDPPRVDSLVEVWASANWYEREAFDLFGILFVGHPDLRRLLTDYGFIGHPFRKDFPLIGEVEMRYDPARRRVVYEPVSIEPRTLVPRVVRHDERYTSDEAGD